MPDQPPSKTAVLLMDLQHDFLAAEGARMPVDPAGAVRVIQTANAILARTALPTALSILIVNQFSPADRVANFFRKQAAIAGTKGANLDARLQGASGRKTFSKSSSSAFTNPDLHSFLKSQGITDLYILGVFAEGCIRATVADARKLGYPVTVIADAIATNTPWKKRLALWSMARAGASVIPTLP